VSSLDAKIDDLYRQPLDEFTSSRNALAKTVTGDEAKRIRALVKPTAVPWAVNQVYWRARPAYDRLIKSGEQIKKAQVAALEGQKGRNAARASAVSGRLHDANDAHRQAIAEAVRQAQHLADDAGVHPALDELTRTFETLSLATAPPEPHGRLTRPLKPAGFEALAGVRLPELPLKPDTAGDDREDAPREITHDNGRLRPSQEAPAARRTAGGGGQPDQRAKAAAHRQAAEAKKREAAAQKAEAALAQARAAETIAREALARATKNVADAEERLDRLRQRS